MELRTYQTDSLDSVFREWERVRSTLLVLPTGAGKTVVIGHLVRRLWREKRITRVLVLAHRTELIIQAVEKIHAISGLGVEVEQASERAWQGFELYPDTLMDPVVASVQTLKGKRLAEWPKNSFTHIVIDEAHHATARSYREIINHFEGAKVLGVTATPDRTDKIGLGGIFESVAYRMDVEDLVNSGHLVDVVAKTIAVPEWDISSVKVNGKGHNRDLVQAQIDRAMTDERMYHSIACPLVKESAGRSTLVYMPGVHSSETLRRILGGYMDENLVAHLDGKTHPTIRQSILERFKAGEIKILTNCMVLTEGFDAPNAEVIALCRPTKSRSLFSQILGRGMRPDPNNADKQTMTFLNFVPDETGHHELITPLDVLGGKPLGDIDDRVREIAEEMMQEKGMRPRDAMTAAERELAERLEEEDRIQREEEQERSAAILARNQAVFVDARYSVGNQGEWERQETAKDDLPSPRVLEFLSKHGIPVFGLNKRQAAEKMRRYTNRLNQGLCTYKQMKCLKRAGIDYQNVSRKKATELIGILEVNRWRVTNDVIAELNRSLREGEI